MTRVILSLAIIAVLPMAASAENKDSPGHLLRISGQDRNQAIVQIGGRQCEYHRSDVEGALRQFEGVRQVEFLNNHGTVLVRFESGAVKPEQLAQAVERALAMGWGCKAWIE